MVALLYAYNVLLLSTRDDQLKWAFVDLASLFERARMCNNIRNTVGMI